MAERLYFFERLCKASLVKAVRHVRKYFGRHELRLNLALVQELCLSEINALALSSVVVLAHIKVLN